MTPSLPLHPRASDPASAQAAELPRGCGAGDVGDGVDVVDDPLEFAQFTRWVSGPAGERWAESSLQLSGLHCAACAGLIEDAVARVPGVCAVRVSATSERASVTWEPGRTQPSALIEAVRRAGYDAVPDVAAATRGLRLREQRQALWRLFVAGFCAMQVMMLATPSYVAAPGDLSDEMRRLLNWASWLLTLPVMAFSATPYFTGAWRSLRRVVAGPVAGQDERSGAGAGAGAGGQRPRIRMLDARAIGMDVPVALGLLITFVASTGATFDPQGPFGHEVYFDSLTMFVSFLLAARWVELLARERAATALERALAGLPETAWRVSGDGSLQAVSALRLRVGDRLRVPVGQAFAADGVLDEGRTEVDEALLTGESAPVVKTVGDAVVAGSLNVGAPVHMTVQRVGGDTRLQGIVSMMNSALAQRPAAARLADRWAPAFLWTVLALAALGAAVWSVVEPARAVWVAVSVLIVTCPCALSLAAPATLVAAARGMARQGLMVQRLDAIEVLARAPHWVFDKTGTLTQDRPVLARTVLAPAAGTARSGPGGQNPSVAAVQAVALGADQALAVAASLAAWSRHPLSQALVAAHDAAHEAAQDAGRPAAHPAADADAQAGIAPVPAWTDTSEHPGLGLQARDAQGGLWRLGAPAWALHDDARTGAAFAPDATVLLCREGVALAAFEFEESLREGAAEGVQALQRQGATLTLLSGDTASRANALARALGLSRAVAQATPEAKLACVTALQQQGHAVVMVGDGVNDAPVLARADASVAMGQGAVVARSQADLVLSSGRIADLAAARQRARKAVRIVRQNLFWAAAYNALCIPLALLGWLPPWAAGLGMATSSLLVVLNAQRAGR